MAVSSDLSPDYANRTGLLAAIAEGGTRGKNAYQQAQAALSAQQQTATQQALAGSLPLTQAQQGTVSGIVGQGYAGQQARLGADAQAAGHELDSTQWNAGGYLNESERVKNLLQSQNADALARLIAEQVAQDEASASRGGGGRGGGGGGGGSEKPYDWRKALTADAGGLKSLVPDYLAAASRGYGDPNQPRDLRARQFAQEQYGVPEFALNSFSPIRGYLASATTALNQAKAGQLFDANKKKVTTYQQFSKLARTQAKSSPGNQAKGRKYIEAQARQVLPKKKR